ncbi:uncharacterized protein isoform X2 [Leptinotarsa decemlineata]|uniref:uncharacterized protein isoform X2 n=1 Tax=Leptinotarsa decemlineata TaxID=7539 RepID=UPI003D3062D2
MKQILQDWGLTQLEDIFMDSTAQVHQAESDNRTFTTLTPVKADDSFQDNLRLGQSPQVIPLESRLERTTDDVSSDCRNVADIPVPINIPSMKFGLDVNGLNDQCFSNQSNLNSAQSPDVPGPSYCQLAGYSSDLEDDSLKGKDYKPGNDDGSSTTSEENNKNEEFRTEMVKKRA